MVGGGTQTGTSRVSAEPDAPAYTRSIATPHFAMRWRRYAVMLYVRSFR
jgi:hypothetical protein